MKFEYMRELLGLQRYGSFTLTSEKLFIAQPSLSRHISAMEKELGVSLIKRDTHQVVFTKEGLEACKTFRKILNTYDNYLHQLEKSKAGIIGTLRIGMLYYTIRHDFGTVLPRFQKAYPNVEISSNSWQPKDVYPALLEQRIDIGVLPRSQFGERNGLLFKDFDKSHAVVMMSNEHPLAIKEEVALSELHEETVVLLRDDPYLTETVLEALQHAGFTPSKTTQTEHTDTVPRELLHSGGIYITGAGYSFPGYENEIAILPISDPDLFFYKSYAWYKENDNPLISCVLNTIE